MHRLQTIKNKLTTFLRSENGSSTIEFLVVLPMFMLLFLMTYESGIISVRHVMLERGLDVTVRSVRIGTLEDPEHDELIEAICENAAIIPDCTSQMELEMVVRDVRSWVDVDDEVKCVDRSTSVQASYDYANGDNNELVILRACARFDPVLPTTGIGYAVTNNSSDEAAGSYALFSTAAFVIEPYDDES